MKLFKSKKTPQKSKKEKSLKAVKKAISNHTAKLTAETIELDGVCFSVNFSFK